MDKLKERLAALAHTLGLTQSVLLPRAQRRYLANRKRAYQANHQREQAEAAADRARAAGHQGHAVNKDKEARKASHVAYKNHLRAQHYLGLVKRLQQRIHDLGVSQAQVKAAIKDLNRVTVAGNKVTGGTPRQRLKAAIHAAALNCSTGAQNNYYSQGGAAADHSHTIAGMPYGHRFDCSSFADGIYDCCGLDNPSGTTDGSGYTGTEGAHGKQVSVSQAQTGDLVLFGPYPHHHVEVVDDPAAQTTIGHGSAPIDRGVFNLFGDSNYIIRSYL